MANATEYIAAPDVFQADTIDPIPLTETDVIVLNGRDRSENLIDPASGTQGTLYIDYTQGNLDNVTIKVYSSYLDEPGANDWYQETDAVGDAGTITLHNLEIAQAGDAQMTWHFPIGAMRSIKVTVEGGGADNTNSEIDLTLAVRSN